MKVEWMEEQSKEEVEEILVDEEVEDVEKVKMEEAGGGGGDGRGRGRDRDGAAEERTHSAGKSSPSGHSGTAATCQLAASPQMARLCR